MKVTGPTKERTKMLVALLEKQGRKSKSAIWIDLADRLSKPRRQRPDVNLWKIEKLSAAFPEKTLVAPGKVLGKGSLSKKATVVAFEFSQSAREKIVKAGGKAMLMEEALKGGKEPAKGMLIVK